MNINITATHMELTEAIEEYAKKKINSLKKLLDTSGDHEVKAKIELGRETNHHQKGDVFKAEVHVTYRKEAYTASATAEDLYSAIDLVKDELSREFVQGKEKRGTSMKKGGRVIKKILKEGR